MILLLINSIAILNEDRFLKRLGLGDTNTYGGQQVSDNGSAFARLIQLIRAIQTVLRIPLIVVNVLVVIYELILG